MSMSNFQQVFGKQNMIKKNNNKKYLYDTYDRPYLCVCEN